MKSPEQIAAELLADFERGRGVFDRQLLCDRIAAALRAYGDARVKEATGPAYDKFAEAVNDAKRKLEACQ